MICNSNALDGVAKLEVRRIEFIWRIEFVIQIEECVIFACLILYEDLTSSPPWEKKLKHNEWIVIQSDEKSQFGLQLIRIQLLRLRMDSTHFLMKQLQFPS